MRREIAQLTTGKEMHQSIINLANQIAALPAGHRIIASLDAMDDYIPNVERGGERWNGPDQILHMIIGADSRLRYRIDAANRRVEFECVTPHEIPPNCATWVTPDRAHRFFCDAQGFYHPLG